MIQPVRLAVDQALLAAQATAYPEPESPLHLDISEKVWTWVKTIITIEPGQSVLDIGCGSGFMLERFKEDGLSSVGLTIDAKACEEINAKGETCLNWDMHDVACFTSMFNGVFARHVLEHSIMPYVMLRSIRQALRPGGWAFIEVPAGGTSSKHDSDNENHYSVLSKAMWTQLIGRSGFKELHMIDVQFATALGPDTYHCFLAIT